MNNNDWNKIKGIKISPNNTTDSTKNCDFYYNKYISTRFKTTQKKIDMDTIDANIRAIIKQEYSQLNHTNSVNFNTKHICYWTHV
jgi:hypothetical protein|tara:strand:+ start:241 stop:495 length:255 start_codon:yes stop_codon:yes gene_type:complete